MAAPPSHHCSCRSLLFARSAAWRLPTPHLNAPPREPSPPYLPRSRHDLPATSVPSTPAPMAAPPSLTVLPPSLPHRTPPRPSQTSLAPPRAPSRASTLSSPSHPPRSPHDFDSFSSSPHGRAPLSDGAPAAPPSSNSPPPLPNLPRTSMCPLASLRFLISLTAATPSPRHRHPPLRPP